MDDPSSPSQFIKQSYQQAISMYQKPDLGCSLWQVTNSILPYFFLLTLMYLSLSVSYWLTLALAFPAAGLMVRIFIIFHGNCSGW